jgi:pyruvate,water dikinase
VPGWFHGDSTGQDLYTKAAERAGSRRGTKIAGLVTDAGGALSHPAVVSREFGIPAVVGTGVASQQITAGQCLRVNGATGVVEVLEAGSV